MRATKTFLAAVIAAAVVAVSPGGGLTQPASAPATPASPDEEALRQARQHFVDGQAKFNAGDKAGAVEEFKRAYKLSRNALLLYNIAYVYDDMHDRQLAVHYYGKFLKDAPENEKTQANRALAQERLKLFEKEVADEEAAAAKARAAQAPTDAPGGKTKPRKSGVSDFTHAVIEDAPPGKPLDIVAKIPDDADWVLTVYYRPAGVDEFKAVKLRPRYTELVARIPAEDVRGSYLHYYLEVKDRQGALVAFSGRSSSPNIVYLDEAAPPHFFADLAERETDDADADADELGGREALGSARSGQIGQITDSDRRLRYAKLGATGGAAVFLGSALAFYLLAADASTSLEGEAVSSQNACGALPSPCRVFSGTQKGYEDDGQAYETWANVTAALGVGAAVAAGVLWYLDLAHDRRTPAADSRAGSDGVRVSGGPLFSRGLIGGQAVISF